jgi:hypothetical protein
MDHHNPADPAIHTASPAPKPAGLQPNSFCRDHRRYPVADSHLLRTAVVEEPPRAQNRLRSDPELQAKTGMTAM